MKKKLLVFVPLLASILSSCGKTYKVEDYILTLDKKANKDFVILQLTDLHIGEKDDFDVHAQFMDLTIRDANPDMIVVTGDLFTFASKSTAKRLFSYFDDKKIPWTVTFGNHDEQCYFSVEWMTRQLNSKYDYCYFKDIQNDDVHGNCNFAINVTENGTLFEQLIMMDSNRYDFKSMYYDRFQKDQMEWYKNLVNQTNETYPGYQSLMFYHIPLPEINDAYAHATDESRADYKKKDLLFGTQGEDPCPPKSDYGFFDVIHSLGSTKAMFFGHDHRNDYAVRYKDVDFVYGLKSTDRVYYDENMLGGLKITLDKDTRALTYEQIHHKYSDVGGSK